MAPLLYLVICLLAFGIFIPFLGFFWDDWPTIFYTHSGRVAQLVTHFSYDRPFSVWGYWLIGRLGSSPLVWQVAALLIRWGVVVAFAWALQPLWPKQNKKIIAVALLFAIYPGYYLQSSSVIFSSHLLAYLFFFISIGAMGRAVTVRKNSLAFTIVAVVSTIIHMFTLEYFVGLELVRPLYLWFLMGNSKKPLRQRLKSLLKLWSPYLVVVLAWFIWRLFLLKLPSEPYPLVIVQALRTNPLTGLAQFLTMAIQDLVYILGSTWSEIIQPSLFRLSETIDIVAWSLAAFSFVFVALALFWLNGDEKKRAEDTLKEQQFAKQAIILGVVALVSGLTPVWLIGERIAQGDYNLRYILVGMVGAALVIGGLIYLIVNNPRHRIVIISLMVALTIGMHVRAANNYRVDWENQRSFFWQLYWRAPDIESNTALISFDRVTTYLGDPMTGNALNVLYPLSSQPPDVDIWNFELTRTETVKRIESGQIIEENYRGLKFKTQSTDDLVFYFVPEGGCLWMLTPSDIDNEFLPFENRNLVANSNLENILDTPKNPQYPDPTVFGSEPLHGWCFYYEKADLARQKADWQTVISLMNEAKAKGLKPNYGIEWLPLVEAYGASGNWESALELSVEVHSMQSKNDPILCNLWETMTNLGQANSIESETFQQISSIANCSD